MWIEAWSKLTCLQNLAAVDLYRYDEAWELEPKRALSQFVNSLNGTGAVLLDLRKPNDFAASHVQRLVHSQKPLCWRVNGQS
jgi:hypothetical protein